MKHKDLCALIAILFFTWNITSLVPQALNHLWEVLLLSGLCQTEDDLHEVSIHQTKVCTFCYFQSLTKAGEKDKVEEQINITVKQKIKTDQKSIFDFFQIGYM